MGATDPSPARRRAVALAGHTGDVELARAGLGDPDASVRASALGACHRLGCLDPDDLAPALADPDPTVRRRAAALALRPGDPPLRELLHDPDDMVAETAAWAMGERSPAEAGAVPALSEVARTHDEPLVREAAVAALGAIGDPEGLAAILVGTRDRPAVRRRAVLALAPFEGPEVDAALETARHDRDWQVRQAAEDLLR